MSKQKAPRQPLNGWLLCTILVAGTLVAFIGYSLQFHTDNIYPLDQIRVDLEQVNGDMPVAGKINIMTQAHSELGAWQGNSKWFYPTSYDNINITRQLLADTAEDAVTLLALANTDNFAYQQGINNINTHVFEVQERIDSYAWEIGMNPTINPIGFILGFLLMGSPIIAIIANQLDQKRFHRERRIAMGCE